jgi:hypothetical protein
MMKKLIILTVLLLLVLAGCCGIVPTPNTNESVTPPEHKGKVTVTIKGRGRVYSSPTKDIDCQLSGGGYSGVCSAVLSDEFPFLVPKPADGWMFSEWQGGGCFAEQCPLTPHDMSEDLYITAVFEQVNG